MKEGREYPPWYLDEPVRLPEHDFWHVAFSELNTCRNSWFMIPYHHIISYGERHKLTEDLIDALVIVIREMDHYYRDWNERQKKVAAEAAKITGA